MIYFRLFLDCRRHSPSGIYPLRVVIRRNCKKAVLFLGLRINVNDWDADSMSVRGSSVEAHSINRIVLSYRTRITEFIHDLQMQSSSAGLDVCAIRDLLSEFLFPSASSSVTLLSRFASYIERLQNVRTQEIYRVTMRKIQKFDARSSSLLFEDISKEWLSRFDGWLPSSGCSSRNARNIHLRNIRAVFNDAIDNDITTAYPFRRFSIRPERTAKRAASVEVLRQFFSYPVLPHQQIYVDAFRLVFCLIGINLVDLLAAKPVRNGRLEYNRAKTGRLYSIKVEPEAEEIISRWHGWKRLVSWGEGRKDYRSFTKLLDSNLQKIGEVGSDGVLIPAFPGFTSYVARHSWATIAASLDIPKETIAHALGHSSNSVTDVYIEFDMRKVDDANRRVLDWVFYGKK